MENIKTINESKLITLLKVLTKKEIKHFVQFVHSPFHNKKKEVIQLFNVLAKEHPVFKKALSKPILYKHIFQDDPIPADQPLDKERDRELRHLMNDLTELIQHFLLYEDMQSNEVRSRHQLSHIFMNRGLNRYVPALLKSARPHHKRQHEGQMSYLYNEFLLSEVTFNHLLIKDNRSKDIELQPLVNGFHQHYIAGQLRYFCAAANRENILPVKYEYPFLDELIQHLSEHDYSHVPLIAVYYRILMLFQDADNDLHFDRLKIILAQQKEKFPITELRYIYAFITNYCNKRVNKGIRKYAVEKLNIYKDNLEKGLWHTGKHINPHQFVLIVKEALSAKEVDWTKNFIEHYQEELPLRWKKSISNLSWAYLYFSKKEFETAHDYLSKIESSEDFFYEIYYRRLLLQIYYEYCNKPKGEEYKNTLDGALEALRFYLRPGRSPKMAEQNREICSNFLNLLRRICRLRFSLRTPSPKRLTTLKEDVLNTELLVDRKWLLEKVEELMLGS